MTAPRSHSQEGSDPPRGFTPRLYISIDLTWPPTVFSPHSSQPVAEPDHLRPRPPLKPRSQGPGSSSLSGWTWADRRFRPSRSLRSARPRGKASPCAPPLRVAGVPASSKKVAGLLRSAPRAHPRLDLSATLGAGSHLHPLHRWENEAQAQLARTSKLPAPCAA